MVKITLTGDVPSKKNSRQIIYVRGRPLIIPSKNHKQWHTQAMSQLYGIKSVARQIDCIELILYPSTKRRGDLSNKFESIADLLVDAGIIEDDNWYIVPKVVLKFGGVDRTNPRAEIYVDTRRKENLSQGLSEEKKRAAQSNS